MDHTKYVHMQLKKLASKHEISMMPGTVMATHCDTGDRLIIDATWETKLVCHTQLKSDGRLVRVEYPDIISALKANNLLDHISIKLGPKLI
jgi:hypothetical protein